MSYLIKTEKIKKEWTDYNGHLNMAYYVLIFDLAWENILSIFQMGEEDAKNNNRSTMVVETHTKYLSEIKEGENIDINLIHLDHDKKRLHFKLEMVEKSKKKISATIEMISLYIDLSKRKVANFDENRIKIMDKFMKVNESYFNKNELMFSSRLKK